MITSDQITITSDLVYEGCGLALCCMVNGELHAAMISDRDIMVALFKTGSVRYVNTDVRMVMRQGKIEFLDDYMKQALKPELAQKIVAYHLNNCRAKPVQIPTKS